MKKSNENSKKETRVWDSIRRTRVSSRFHMLDYACYVQIEFVGERRIRDDTLFEHTLIDTKREQPIPKEKATAFIDQLVPRTYYTFNITAVFNDGPGPVRQHTVQTSNDGSFLFTNYK